MEILERTKRSGSIVSAFDVGDPDPDGNQSVFWKPHCQFDRVGFDGAGDFPFAFQKHL